MHSDDRQRSESDAPGRSGVPLPAARSQRGPREIDARGRIVADGGYERIPIDDWDALAEHLRRFAAGGRVEVSDERIDVRVGSARFAVTREGDVETGMPLHDFATDDVAALAFDHGGGAIRVAGRGVEYEFRRP